MRKQIEQIQTLLEDILEEAKDEKVPTWQKITLRDLHKIRPGVTLKRIYNGSESIIHVGSDPYWTSWKPENMRHIFVYRDRHNCENSINDLFNGEVYIQKS